MSDNKNIQAFPSKEIDWQESSMQGQTVYNDQNPGMTLRDYFAAKAMASVILVWNTEATQSHRALLKKSWSEQYGNKTVRDCVALDSYNMADAMLKAREK